MAQRVPLASVARAAADSLLCSVDFIANKSPNFYPYRAETNTLSLQTLLNIAQRSNILRKKFTSALGIAQGFDFKLLAMFKGLLIFLIILLKNMKKIEIFILNLGFVAE